MQLSREDLLKAYMRMRTIRERAPFKMVTPPHTPVPFAGELEDLYIPSPAKIQAAVTEVVRYE
ncbi:MAG TPA: hypothetical protein VFP43_17535 [Mesorhizobium sp.]|nr:hypothetical protein [Mesorhizobium sp.]